MVSRARPEGATAAASKLGVRPFLEEVRDAALGALPASLGAPVSRVVFTSLQVHFGDPRLHYEVWPVRKTGRIEVGLHLEGPREWSRAVAGRLAEHGDELRAALGPTYELEDWTASWCRLHTTLPLRPLDAALALEVGAALAGLVRASEPLLRHLNPGPAPSVPRQESGRGWRGR